MEQIVEHFFCVASYQAEPPKKPSSWRKKHEDFISTIRAAKAISQVMKDGGPLPPPPPPTYDPGNMSLGLWIFTLPRCLQGMIVVFYTVKYLVVENITDVVSTVLALCASRSNSLS